MLKTLGFLGASGSGPDTRHQVASNAFEHFGADALDACQLALIKAWVAGFCLTYLLYIRDPLPLYFHIAEKKRKEEKMAATDLSLHPHMTRTPPPPPSQPPRPQSPSPPISILLQLHRVLTPCYHRLLVWLFSLEVEEMSLWDNTVLVISYSAPFSFANYKNSDI